MHESCLQFMEMLQWVDLLTELVILPVLDVCEIIWEALAGYKE